jgi:ribosomal protein L16 Arg81 hydroxylase
MDFNQIIAPLTREQFFADHHHKAFACLRGARGRFADMISWDELNTILEQHRLTPPRLKLAQDGAALDPARYLSPGLGGAPRLDSGKFITCLSQGATLILDAMEELTPRMRTLSNVVREEFRSGNVITLYAGWRSQNGFDLHWDSQDTFILQVFGKKRWQIHEPTRLHPLENDIEAAEKPEGEPVWDGVLEDGDALYVPRGWWHMAYPLDEPSLHLTIATVHPNGADFLSWIAGRLRQHEALREDLPALTDAAGQRAYLSALRKIIDDALSEESIGAFRHEWDGDSFPRPHIRLPDAPYLQATPIDDYATVRLTAAHRLHLESNGDDVEFKANGVVYILPAALAPALEMLTDTRALKVSALMAKTPGEAAKADLRKSLAVLARTGIMLVNTD